MLKKKIILWMLLLWTCITWITKAETTLIWPQCSWTPTMNSMMLRVRVDLEWNNTYYITTNQGVACGRWYTDYKERHQNTYEIDENWNIRTWNLWEKYLWLYHAWFWWSYTDRARRSASRTDDWLAYAWRWTRNINWSIKSWIITTFTEEDYQTYWYNGTQLTIEELKQIVWWKITWLTIWWWVQNSPDSAYGKFCYDSSINNKSYCMNTIEWTYPLTRTNNDQPTTYFGNNSNFITTSPLIWWWTNNQKEYEYCWTVEDTIYYYPNTFNTWMCYTPNKEWSWSIYTWERVTVTPKSIFEIFETYQEYELWRWIYVNSCHPPYTQEYCLSRMQWNPYATTFFTNVENQWIKQEDFKLVYQYCYLNEIEDKTQKICEMENWWLAPWLTWNDNVMPSLIDIVLGSLEENKNILDKPKDWTVFDELLPEWILSREDVALDLNFLKNTINWARKFMEIFIIRTEREWIIPEVISSIILLFIFYRMLKK